MVMIDDSKDEFSAAITPVFGVTWSLRNHSNMLCCQCWKLLLNISFEAVIQCFLCFRVV